MGFLFDIYSYIKSGETDSENLGLEIEHFVVNDKGVQIGFDEVTALIEKIGTETGSDIIYVDGYPVGYINDKYSISLEPSCQFEISINPYSNLADIADVYQEFLDLWEPVFSERGYHFETKGNLPSVEKGQISPYDIPLSPKKRYRYMDEYLQKSGKYGVYMMRASASTQVSIDYKSEQDLIRKLQVLQKISPILMIMMENKTEEETTLPGVEGKPHLFRIQEWDDLDPDRTGFYPFSMDEDFGYKKISDVIYHTPLILLSDEGKTDGVGHKNAEDLVKENVIPDNVTDDKRKTKLVEHVMSMGFFHFRIKKYIEVRIADSVPIKKALGYVALLKGLIYSEHNLTVLENELSYIDNLKIIQDAVLGIEVLGRDAVIYEGLSADEWANRLKSLALNVLDEKEKEYLNYV